MAKTSVWIYFLPSLSIRLSIKKSKLFIDSLFKKEAPALKTKGNIEGLDLGYANLAVCSNGQMVGEKINKFIEGFDKREKHTHKQIEQKVFGELKKSDLGQLPVHP